MLSYDSVAGIREFERLNRAVMDGNLEVPIAGTYSLASAAKAHKRIEKGHVLGKIVLRIN
ncbi:MAG TPA: zinc-binding dehydrogenase [Pyrinomonadaceae bacterium]|nr:zinc-binding dehydrogenase [Pyrinomonadaceae bacterium]